MLSCYDRVVITGTLPTVCYAEGMTRFLYAKGIRIFDYPVCRTAARAGARTGGGAGGGGRGGDRAHRQEPHPQGGRRRAGAGAARHASRPGARDLGDGACDAYQPWHDKQTHKTFLRPDSGKCLHYYFYFMDAELGLVYLRVPTWAPFRLQFYCNGHNWLARKLTANGIAYTMADNAFVRIADWRRAQELADAFCTRPLHRALDRYARAVARC